MGFEKTLKKETKKIAKARAEIGKATTKIAETKQNVRDEIDQVEADTQTTVTKIVEAADANVKQVQDNCAGTVAYLKGLLDTY